MAELQRVPAFKAPESLDLQELIDQHVEITRGSGNFHLKRPSCGKRAGRIFQVTRRVQSRAGSWPPGKAPARLPMIPTALSWLTSAIPCRHPLTWTRNTIGRISVRLSPS